MARNIFQYALLGGIQGGAQGLAQGMAEEQRFERERQLMAEREAERRSYLEEQRTRGGGTRSGGGAVAGPFDPAEADKRVAYQLGKKPEDLPAYERGDDLMTAPQQVTPSAANDWQGGEVPAGKPPGFDELVAKRREELKMLRGGAVYGNDLKDVAAGMATLDDTARLGRIEQGDRGAVRAKLADKGNGEFGSLNGGGGVFSSVDGRQDLNPMGRAEVNKDNAAAGESAADAKKKLRDAEDALKTGSAEKLYQQISSIRPITENMLLPKEQREQAGRVLSMLMNEVEKSRGGGSGSPAAPAAPQRGGASAPKPSGKAPYQEGQRLRGSDGKTYVVRNGKPVPA